MKKDFLHKTTDSTSRIMVRAVDFEMPSSENKLDYYMHIMLRLYKAKRKDAQINMRCKFIGAKNQQFSISSTDLKKMCFR